MLYNYVYKEKGVIFLKTKLKNSSEYESYGYGAGPGDVERYEYECMCGEGSIIEQHDNIPGFRDHTVYWVCAKCSEKYFIDTSKGVRSWCIKEIE